MKRALLAIAIVMALFAVGAEVFVHTEAGRQFEKTAIEKRLQRVLAGSVTIGSLEGTPFSTLVLHDVAIDDADGHPALRIGTVRLQISIPRIIEKRIQLDHVIAEDVTAYVARDQLAKLIKPHPRSHWDFEIPDVEVRRGRIVGDVALDGVEIRGRISYPYPGPMRADLAMSANGGAFAAVSVRQDRDGGYLIPSLLAHYEGATVAALGVSVQARTGVAFVDLPAGRIAGANIPEHVRAFAQVSPGLLVDAIGTYGTAPVELVARGDLDQRRVQGFVTTSGLHVPSGRVAGAASFDMRFGHGLPTGTAIVSGSLAMKDLSCAQFLLAIASDGTRITLGTGHAIAKSLLLRLDADVTGRGELYPHPDLAVAGAIDGADVHLHGISAASLHIALDAQHVPSAPVGTANVAITRLARGDVKLQRLALSVTARGDRKLAVKVASAPRDAKWFVDADAVVSLGSTIDIALGHHEVRVGPPITWRGNGGKLAISSTRVTAKLATTSELGTFSIDGAFDRRTNEIISATVAATVHAQQPILERLGIATTLGAEIDVTAHLAGTRGTASAHVRQLHGKPFAQPIDIRVDATTDARSTHATLALRGPGDVDLGDATLAIPRTATKIRRDSPIAATLDLAAVPAALIGAVLGRDQVVGGTLDGRVAIAGTLGAPTVDAKLVATHLAVPHYQIEKVAMTGSWNAGAFAVDLSGSERTGGDLHFAARGRVDRPDEIAATLDAKQFDLAPVFAVVAPGGSGRLDAKLAATGLDPRKVTGTLHVVDGMIPIAPTIGTLRHAKLDVTIDRAHLVAALEAKLGAGTVTARATSDLVTASLDAKLRKVALIGYVQPILDADITAKVHRDAKQWIADVVVDRGKLAVPLHRGARLAPVGGPKEMVFVGDKPAENKPATAPTLIANVVLHPVTLAADDMIAHAVGKLQLRAGGGPAIVTGDIAATDGDVDLFGRRYVVESAALHFDGSFDPLLDVRVWHDFADVTTTTTIRGRWLKPAVAMTSDPGVYTQGQMLGFLIDGEAQADPRDVAARDRASAGGASLRANEIGSFTRKTVPLVDVVRYETATTYNTAALTAGTWIYHPLFVAYRRHFQGRPDENISEGTMELWLNHHVTLEGTLGDRGYDGIDLLWRKRY